MYKTKEVVEDFAEAEVGGSGKLTAPMPGKIVKVISQLGKAVKINEIVLVMEAMKMEHSLKAPMDGVVKSVNLANWDIVRDGQLLAVVS